MDNIQVLILMGSKSDQSLMQQAADVLTEFDILHDMLIRSAHRTPDETLQTIRDAEDAGCQVFICAAGMAAHLAGMVAAHTVKPVIGVPVSSGSLQGQDALLSTVMMPPGIPVATVAINGAKNAALLAVQMLALQDHGLMQKLQTNKSGNS